MDPLPLYRTVIPPDQETAAQAVRECAAESSCLYPMGGGTALDYGLPARVPGLGLSLAGLNRVEDYPARDMTITVEAGIPIRDLQQTLSQEGQRLPVDVSDFSRATLGGALATNVSGPRRFAHGTLRDYVIGIRAIDGTGVTFNAGGRVVKNVAGYDFCKLLTGSLGTLAVIVQATLKVTPSPQASTFVIAETGSLEQADALLAGISTSKTAPTAVEWLSGPIWAEAEILPAVARERLGWLAVGLEGNESEVRWSVGQLLEEWRLAGTTGVELAADQTSRLWELLIEFPARRASPLTLKIAVPPSRTMSLVRRIRGWDPNASLQAHAGNGILFVHSSEMPAGGAARALLSHIRPAAQAVGGNASLWRAKNGIELTHQTAWGAVGSAGRLMEAVKRQFDPQGILNPGRFVYSHA